MNPATLRMTGLFLAAGLLLAAGFFSCFERKLVDVPKPGSEEARRNPYLALGRLLEAMGHEVHWLEGPGSLDELPPPEATLLLTSSRHTLTERRAAPLLAWVRGGGHLITTVHSTWEKAERDPDPLIDPIGLFGYRELEEEGEADEDALEVDSHDEPEIPAALEALLPGVLSPESWDLTTVQIEGRKLEVDFLPPIAWAEPGDVASWAAYGETGAHLAQVELGAGRVTALTDDALARNERVGERDHAELLVRLVGLVGSASEAAPVWIVISERWPGLLSQILKHAAPAAVAATVLLIAWLWQAARRFGPLAPDSAPERRRWIEHLDAVGRFHWRRDRGTELLDATRGGLSKTLARSHPTWATLPEQERNERIGEVSGLPAVQVAAALEEHRRPTSEADMVRTIARIERIRAAL